MEILTYLPAFLLKKDPADMELDEFLKTLAKSMYVQELKSREVAAGIRLAFGEED